MVRRLEHPPLPGVEDLLEAGGREGGDVGGGQRGHRGRAGRAGHEDATAALTLTDQESSVSVVRRSLRAVSHVLAIDLGTGGPKVALVDLDGTVAATAFEPVETQLGPGGAAEQRPQDWWGAIVTCSRRLAAQRADELRAAVAVAVTGQWAGTVAVDAAGEPLAPALTWLDSRGAAQSRRIAGAGAGGVRVEGYAPQRLARWIRLTGGAPSLAGRDPFAHLQFLRDQRPDDLGGGRDVPGARRLAQPEAHRHRARPPTTPRRCTGSPTRATRWPCTTTSAC